MVQSPLPPSRLASLRAAAVMLAALGLTSPAAAQCVPPSGHSPCFDANSRWTVPAPSAFVSFAAPLPPSARGSVALAFDYLERPVVLDARAPDPSGRELAVVDHRLDAALTGSFAPLRRLQLTAALPFVLAQSGSGLSGVTTTSPQTLDSPALRDPRLGLIATALSRRFHGGTWLGLQGELELALPVGNELAFAGARSVVAAPRLSTSVFFTKRFRVGASVGLRLKQPIDFATTRLGHQLTTAVGVGAEVLEEHRLTLALEARALATLRSQDGVLPNGTRVSGAHVPGEWLATARTAWPVPRGRFTAFVGGGTGIPLSTRRSSGEAPGDDRFAGVPAPAWRAVLGARYSFD